MSRIKLKNVDGKLVAGGVLNDQQKQALNSVTPTADEILANMNAYNEQIESINDTNEEVTNTLPKANKVKSSKTVKSKRRSRAKQKFDASNRVKPPEKPNTTMENIMNFDQELENISETLDNKTATTTEDTATVTETTQQDNFGPDMKSQILELLGDRKDAPSQQHINSWKAQHGQNSVHCMALGEDDIYIFTHLKRGQWQKIQEIIAKAAEIGNSEAEDKLKEKVIQHCVLWPTLTLEFFYNSKAGVIDSLYQVILLNSYF